MRKNEYGNRANIVRLRNVRVAPRKMRVLIDLVRNKPVTEALALLEFSGRGAAPQIVKLIESGVHNVMEEIPDWDEDMLVISSAWVDEGPTMRRWRPRARGMATRIRKRTSHVTIELRPADLL